MIPNLLEMGTDTIINIGVLDLDTKFYRTHLSEKVLKGQETEKKKKYLADCLTQLRHFTSFVLANMLIGYKACFFWKHISWLLSEK